MCISAISLICLEKTPIAPIANEWWWSASAMWWRRILFTTANAVSVENLLPEFGSSILLFKTSLIPWDVMRHSMVAVEPLWTRLARQNRHHDLCNNNLENERDGVDAGIRQRCDVRLSLSVRDTQSGRISHGSGQRPHDRQRIHPEEHDHGPQTNRNTERGDDGPTEDQ